MTREQAERIVRCYDNYKQDQLAPGCRSELQRLQQQYPKIKFLNEDKKLTREFRHFVAGVRGFLKEARRLEEWGTPEPNDFADGILVFGSCHLDVWGDVRQHQTGVVDQPGFVSYSVGGTAYNIAFNLSSRALPVAIFSSIKEGSAVSEYILRRVREAGISDKYLQTMADLPESAFVAHRVRGELVAAVSSMSIEADGALDQARVREAIQSARLVVLECNLSEKQIHSISRLAFASRRPVLCAGVSEPKAGRICASYRPESGFGLMVSCMNQNEFVTHVGESNPVQSAPLIREKLNSETVFVTRGAAGYDVISREGFRHFNAPEVETLVNTSGAGDALFSGIVHSIYCNNGQLDLDDCQKRIEHYVRDVLSEVGSTVGATVDPSELVHRARNISTPAVRPRTLTGRLVHVTGKVWKIPALIVAILAVPAFFFSDEFEKFLSFVLRHATNLYHWFLSHFS